VKGKHKTVSGFIPAPVSLVLLKLQFKKQKEEKALANETTVQYKYPPSRRWMNICTRTRIFKLLRSPGINSAPIDGFHLFAHGYGSKASESDPASGIPGRSRILTVILLNRNTQKNVIFANFRLYFFLKGLGEISTK
jgi:hypothetical protein